MHEVLETMLATFQLTNNLLFSSIMLFKWLLLFHISVGAPIPVRKAVPNPSTQQINKLHKRYVQELINLFEEHKHRYGLPTTVKLNIVWWNLQSTYWHMYKRLLWLRFLFINKSLKKSVREAFPMSTILWTLFDWVG